MLIHARLPRSMPAACSTPRTLSMACVVSSATSPGTLPSALRPLCPGTWMTLNVPPTCANICVPSKADSRHPIQPVILSFFISLPQSVPHCSRVEWLCAVCELHRSFSRLDENLAQAIANHQVLTRLHGHRIDPENIRMLSPWNFWIGSIVLDPAGIAVRPHLDTGFPIA